jgi:hypothetical protein
MLSDAIFDWVESPETPNWESFDVALNEYFDSGDYDEVYTVAFKAYVYMRRRNRDALIAIRVQLDEVPEPEPEAPRELLEQ